MLEEIQTIICPNPKCKKSIKNTILIYNKSVFPNEIYHGCPYCFSTIESTSKTNPKIIENQFEIKTISATTSEPLNVSNCPQYFGFLGDHFKDSIIMHQCLVCDKMLDCTQKIDAAKKFQEEKCVA